MPNSPTTKRLLLQCPDNCSLRPAAIGAGVTAALTAMREQGAGRNVMSARAAELLGHPVPTSNMQRHFEHYRDAVPEDEEILTGKAPSHVEILDKIVEAGYRNSKSWRPTLKDVMEAMKLKASLTGQSAFEDMLTAMNAALDEADEEDANEEEEQAPENVEAVLSPDERVADDGDDA